MKSNQSHQVKSTQSNQIKSHQVESIESINQSINKSNQIKSNQKSCIKKKLHNFIPKVVKGLDMWIAGKLSALRVSLPARGTKKRKGRKFGGKCTPRAGKLTRTAGKRVRILRTWAGGLGEKFYATFFLCNFFGSIWFFYFCSFFNHFSIFFQV